MVRNDENGGCIEFLGSDGGGVSPTVEGDGGTWTSSEEWVGDGGPNGGRGMRPVERGRNMRSY